MKLILADTNILVQKIRQSIIWEDIEKTYFKKGIKNYGFISYVTVGELSAFAYENGWGKNKMGKLRTSYLQFQPVLISSKRVVDYYMQISAYSHDRHKSLRLPKKFSVRNMGKNDLWIAATAAAGEMSLITSDKDFFHLDGRFIEVIYIDQEKYFSPDAHV
ncbi:MAG TPA: PIN domain-containing protein [Bacteroidetes bacterium]|nr:PIN domain-containing protein [Bacteroidota bacterium]